MFRATHSPLVGDTLVLILAGGSGKRLSPLTQGRAKGAVSFAGIYRLIDFALSNCLHSGLRDIAFLVQGEFASLERHVSLGWDIFRSERSGSVEFVPPPADDGQYLGTADAIHQNIEWLERKAPHRVLLLGSDHVYRMDYGRFLDDHVRSGAELTVGCIEVKREEARRFGVVETDAFQRVVGFIEKPDRPPHLPSRPGVSLASMGIYVFDARALIDVLKKDCGCLDSTRDFGRDVVPGMIADKRPVYAYNVHEKVHRDFYWRDIGTLDAYWGASMELLAGIAPFDPFDPEWPVHTFYPGLSAAQILARDRSHPRITDTLLCPGVQVADARVMRSVLGPGVTVASGAEISESVLLDDVHVGEGARIHRAIIDEGVRVPAHCRIGGGLLKGGRDFYVSPGGITIVPKGPDEAWADRGGPASGAARVAAQNETQP